MQSVEKMPSETDFDVIVAGYGLAGETATSLIARLGHRVCAFERYPELYGLPRTVSFDGESQRIVDKAADHAEATRESTTINAYEIMDADLKPIIAQRWSDEAVCGFHNRVSFYQPHLEAALDKGAREHGAQVELGWEVVAVAQEPDRVVVTVREHATADGPTLENPAERRITARYLIGADGARSTVREAVGADWEFFDYSSAWMSVDVMRKGAVERFDPHIASQIISPERVIAAIPIGDRRIRFEFLLGGDAAEHEALTEDDCYRFLEEAWGITRDEVEIYRSVVYPFEGRMSDVWRRGRVLLAGDAAHLMPPFTGMGAVSAFRDTGNLAWKLDFVLRGLSPEGLLDTYQEERAPNTLHYINTGVAMGHLFTIDDPQAARERDERMRSGGTEFPPEPEYDHGVFNSDDGGPIRPAGTRAPMGRVRRGASEGRFDDVVGWGFAIVAREGDPAAVLDASQRAFLDRIGCSITKLGEDGPAGVVELDDEYERWLDQHGVIGFVSRPDFRVFAGIRTLEEIPALVDDLGLQLGASVPA
jgi:3-(3-hydroxy-phenyl)propionate hydroxylase